MASHLILLLLLAMSAASDGAWCVCRSDLSDSVLQKSLDYACGAGADCGPILKSGGCFNPDTVKSHCSYAVNSYYQRKGQTPQACDFSGSATLTNSDPSYSGCAYPASTSAAGTSTPTSGGSTGGTATPGIYSPPGTVMGGLGPSGNAMTDNSSASILPALQLLILACSLMVLYFTA